MPLTATKAKNAKAKNKDYKLSDEKGMFLLVRTNGRKYWRLKYRFGGKYKTLAIGVFPEVSLKEARDKRDDARKLLDQGVDPSAHKKLQKQVQNENIKNSFEVVGREWHSVKLSDKGEHHRKLQLRLLEKELLPQIGNRPVSEITAPELLSVLRKIENRGTVDTAHRVKSCAGMVFKFAIATGRAERNPANDLSGALRPRTVQHFAAITDPVNVGRLMVAIDGYEGTNVVKGALKLSALTFLRPGELRHLEWKEIDFDNKVIEIPAEKMKMKQSHIVPVSRQGIQCLQNLIPVSGDGRYVFPNARGASKPLSDNGVRCALRTMGYDNNTMTPHGFRAMARTILDEVLGFRIEWIEQQLAHEVKDANGRAYNRTKHLKQRTEMMQVWANYLDELKEQIIGKNVIHASFS